MAADYSIPWQPLDMRPGAQFLLGVLRNNREQERADENARTQRMFAEQNLAVSSARAKRDEEEFKRKLAETEHRRAVERSQQFGPLTLAARKYGVAYANEMAKPWKISFAERPAPQGRVAPDLFGAANNAYGDFAQRTLAGEPTQAPPEAPDDGLDAVSGGAPIMPPGAQHGPGDALMQPDPVAEETARYEAAPKPQLMMSVDGREVPVPQAQESTGLGPEYDAIYSRLLETGMNDAAAMKMVIAQHQKDILEGGRNTRQQAAIASQDERLDRRLGFTREENEKYRRTFDQAKELAETTGRYRVAAAAPQFKQESANDRMYSLLERRGSALRQTTQFSKLVQADKTVRGLMINIARGTVPLQHADAQIQLARFFRGTTPTEGEMKLLYHNLGGTMDKWNQFVARLKTGDLSPEQLRQLKISAKAVQREHDEDRKRWEASARKALGPGSGFENIPDQAQAMFDMMAAELGFEEGEFKPLYPTTGGISLGSKVAPEVRPRAEGRGALDSVEAEVDSLGR